MPKVEYGVITQNPRGQVSGNGIQEAYLDLCRGVLERAYDDYNDPHCIYDRFTENDGKEWAGLEVSKKEVLDFVRHKPTFGLYCGGVDIETAQQGFSKRLGVKL